MPQQRASSWFDPPLESNGDTFSSKVKNAEHNFFGSLAKTLGGSNNMGVKSFSRTMAPFMCEFWGTMMVTLTISFTGRTDEGHEESNTLAPLAIGSMVMSLVYAYGHVSGANFNPAATLTLFMRGKMSLINLVPYFCFQVAGAIAGAQIAARSIGQQNLPLMTFPDTTSVGDAFLIEFLYTYTLSVVILNTATTTDLDGNQFYGLAIGFNVLAAATAIGPVTGACLNPAFATAFRVIHRSTDYLWLYWVACLSGAFVAGIMFHITNSEEADLRFKPLKETSVEHRAAAVGGHTSTYHGKVSIAWRDSNEDESEEYEPKLQAVDEDEVEKQD